MPVAPLCHHYGTLCQQCRPPADEGERAGKGERGSGEWRDVDGRVRLHTFQPERGHIAGRWQRTTRLERRGCRDGHDRRG
ncbi:hypothetical protein TPA0906_58820 [Streptomyces olivaceus]|nr:hypothetical protein TPA0906_58820 [Streptomyces olivaceus]